MPPKSKGPILEYGRPQPGRAGEFARVFAFGLAGVAIVGVLTFLPSGNWSFGPSPQLHLSVDTWGLTFGRYDAMGTHRNEYLDQYFYVGTFSLIFVKLLLVGLPIWIVNRSYSRRREKRTIVEGGGA